MDLSLLGLFTGTMLASTLVPVSSEAMLAAALAGNVAPWGMLVAIATLGNSLGCLLNWLTGRFLLRFQDRRWFPVSTKSLARATRWMGSWGYWSLLLSWLPVVGDALTLAAGVLRVPLVLFLPLTVIGRLGRYLVVVAVFFGAT